MEQQKNTHSANGARLAADRSKSGAQNQHRDQPRKDRTDDEIEENLRRVYSRMLEEQVPERFTQLIEQLKRKGATK
ncbi:hypothetical protein LV82_01209 [Albidovulum inexpectatum]|uniref:Anti-sigma factor NepR domain-containing protein n=1 Tax=Albidovulum inexpectatum TaxID=196587 RepID=A0A2S5JI18_9RHOB|nr:NepR family anti-sigma factor [Albidovulum inexpectatum]PPB81167.1 hypothetical protein LV82_01209 [Albidovulum inexpectatum]